MARAVAAACLATMLLGGGAAQAQDADSSGVSGWTLGVWTAVARDQLLKTRVGHLNDRDLYLVGLRARRQLASRSRVELAYTAELLPAVVSTGMPHYEPVPFPECPPSEPCLLTTNLDRQQMTRQTVYGAGIVPLGIELRFSALPRMALLLRGTAGLVAFTRPVPDPGEERLNYTLDVGAGAEVRLTQRVGLAAGYRMNHLSNGGRGPVNPGMDSRMVEIGLIFAR